MPVLRMPMDNTLAESLGGIGNALAQAWNPKTRAEAMMLQQRMMLEQFQLQREQRLQQATEAAAQQYAHVVPPQYMPEITRMILQNAPHEAIVKAAAGYSGKLVDDPSDAGTAKNIAFMNSLDPSTPWKEIYPPIAGPQTLKHSQDIQAMQAGAVAGQTEAAKGIAQQQVKMAELSQMVDDPTKNAQNLEHWRAAGNPDPPSGVVNAGPNTLAYGNRIAATQKGAEAQSTAAGTRIGGGTKLSEPLFVPDQTSSTSPQPTSPTATTPPTTPPPVSALPPAQPGQVVRQVQGGTVIGTTPLELEQQKSVFGKNQEALQTAWNARAPAADIKVKLGQVSEFANMLDASGPGQISNAAITYAKQHFGVTIGTRAEAHAALDAVINSELPDLKGEFVRLASPELTAAGKQIGTADMPPGVLNLIVANKMALADAAVARGNQAGDILASNDPNKFNNEWYSAEKARQDALQASTDALRSKYGSIGTRPQDQPYQAPAVQIVPKDQNAPAPVVAPPAPAPGAAIAVPGSVGSFNPMSAASVDISPLQPAQAQAAPAPAAPAPALPLPPQPKSYIFQNGQLVEQ